MKRQEYLVLGSLLIAMMASIPSAAIVGSSVIRAPAVILYNNTGSLTTISLTVTSGSGVVSFTNASSVANSTVDSAVLASQFGSHYANRNYSKYNFTYTVNDGGGNVSGPSAGAAMTLLTISAFEKKPLRNDITITGTITPQGLIGPIGGAIDKVAAAYAGGLSVVLVPHVPAGSLSQGIYYIAQNEYDLPLVEVSNISQAIGYEFSNRSAVGNEVLINFTNDYKVGVLAPSQLSCSNSCDETPFAAFTNYTLKLTQNQIKNLSASVGFGMAANELENISEQADAIHQKGYLYIAADIDFLNYLDAFYLSSYNATRDGALGYMQNVQIGCTNLTAPQITFSNYEYVIGAQLRQGWANYTMNATLASYNVSGATRDDIVSAMYSTGQAQAWCGAASFLYGYSYPNSTPAAFSPSLGQIALDRINRASSYPGMYLTLAKQAYEGGDYPVAIIDADYAYVLNSQTLQVGSNSTKLVNQSLAIASSARYGVWATEFSKEAFFYAYESNSSNNSTAARFYAQQAYTSASLAMQLSNDTKLIYGSLISAPTSSSQSGTGGSSAIAIEGLSKQIHLLTIIVCVALALIIGCIALIAILAYNVMALSARQQQGGKGKRAR